MLSVPDWIVAMLIESSLLNNCFQVKVCCWFAGSRERLDNFACEYVHDILTSRSLCGVGLV